MTSSWSGILPMDTPGTVTNLTCMIKKPLDGKPIVLIRKPGGKFLCTQPGKRCPDCTHNLVSLF